MLGAADKSNPDPGSNGGAGSRPAPPGEAAADAGALPVPDVKQLRESLAMTQAEFARTYRLAVGTLRDWEQGRYPPEGPARALLAAIARMPDEVARALNPGGRPAPTRRMGPARASRARPRARPPAPKAPSELGDVVARLARSGELVPAAEAGARIPREPGLYAIVIDDPRNLPGAFGAYLAERSSAVLYVGVTSTSLRKRLAAQDLRHAGPSTFFRGLGAILGYRPPIGSLKGKKNQNNYQFNEAGRRAVADWIERHLSVRWIAAEAESAGALEPLVIGELRPPLNTEHNPDALPELSELRGKCREVALM